MDSRLREHEVTDLMIAASFTGDGAAIGFKRVFKVELDGTKKTRICVQSFRQRHGIDCG